MVFNKEKILIIISALIIFGVLILGYFWIFLNRQVESPKNVVSPVVEPPPASTNNIGGTYSNKSLGLSFQYPKAWGETRFEENIGLNYLFPTYPPDELANEFTKRGLGNDFITTFKSWGYEKQIEFLKKERKVPPVGIEHKLLLTIEEAAAVSGLTVSRLEKAVKGRELKLVDGKIRRTDLEAFVAGL